MRKDFILLCFTLFMSAQLYAQTVTESFNWDGLNRSYRVYLPEGYVDGASLPLVLNFHGFTSTAEQQEVYSAMNTVADTGNFIVVYPQGIGNAWNVGWLFGSMADDVGFTNALIDTLHADYNINLDRVYSTGMSNGGFFSYRLACELNDRIAKIASVTGSMSDAQVSFCMPDNPIPVMQIHGTADPVVGYGGTAGVNIPIETLLSNWGALNGCTSVSDTIFLDDIDPDDGTTAQLIQYRDCDDDVLVVFFKINDGGHTWPGASLPIGVTSQDFSASSEIWNFFNDHYPADQDQFVVDVDELTISEPRVEVFPNPFQDNFTIVSTVAKIESIRIFNAIGQELDFYDALDAKLFQINEVDWDTGIYFIQVKTGLGIQTVKVVKR